MTEKKLTKTTKIVRPDHSSGEYIRTIGRRKTATAIVKLNKASKTTHLINGKELNVYFPTADLRNIVSGALEVAKTTQKFHIVATVRGSGIHSQAEAVRHGISRGLVVFDGELRSALKKAKMLKRDPRQKERRKFGLKKARKAPKWSKR